MNTSASICLNLTSPKKEEENLSETNQMNIGYISSWSTRPYNSHIRKNKTEWKAWSTDSLSADYAKNAA